MWMLFVLLMCGLAIFVFINNDVSQVLGGKNLNYCNYWSASRLPSCFSLVM